MTCFFRILAALFICTSVPAVAAPMHSRMVEGERGVQLEVLDGGGTGRPIVFLAGLGNTAHDLETLATHFTHGHRVIGITRRDFGRSSHPAPTEANYTPERLVPHLKWRATQSDAQQSPTDDSLFCRGINREDSQIRQWPGA